VDGGIPINFVRGTDSTGAGFSSSGLGNVYGDLRLNYKNPLLNYFTTLTGFASTGDTKHGLNTGPDHLRLEQPFRSFFREPDSLCRGRLGQQHSEFALVQSSVHFPGLQLPF